MDILTNWVKSSLEINLFVRESQNSDSEYDCDCIDLNNHKAGIVVYAGKCSKERKAIVSLAVSAPELLEALQHGLRLAKALPNSKSIAVRMFVKSAEKAINKALK